MPIWFLMMFVVTTPNMDGHAKLHVSNDAQYNNEESCKLAGAVIAKELSAKLPENAKVMFVCQSLDFTEIRKALPPSI
jgi:hypothetical protein